MKRQLPKIDVVVFFPKFIESQFLPTHKSVEDWVETPVRHTRKGKTKGTSASMCQYCGHCPEDCTYRFEIKNIQENVPNKKRINLEKRGLPVRMSLRLRLELQPTWALYCWLL